MGNLMCLETEYIYGSHDFYNGYVHDRNGIRLGERDKYKPADMHAGCIWCQQSWQHRANQWTVVYFLSSSY